MRAIGFHTKFGFCSRREMTGPRGFTLVEIMVALTLGLLVMIGVIQVFISTQQSARIQQAASRMQEDGRIAMDILNQYIRLAGYAAYPWDKALNIGGAGSTWNPAMNERGFPADANWPLAGQIIRGGESDVNGADSIRIRYQGADDGSITTCLGRVVPANNPALPINQLMADITFSLSPPDADGGRALWCTDNSGPNPVPQPLVGGLQDMQIWYGLSQGAGGIQANGRLTGATAYVRADQVPANEWDRVIGVRISLLVRSDQDRLTLEPQNIVFNDAPLTVNDRRMRYVMGTTANVRNQSP